MTHRSRSFLRTAWLLCFVALAGCSNVNVDMVDAAGPVQTPDTFDHAPFDRVLRGHVRQGRVDYAGLRSTGALEPYLQSLAATDPARLDSTGRLAFWINAYNALTLKLIADNYPTENILRLTPVGIPGLSFVIPKANSPFTIEVGKVGGAVRTLDEIEHEILRREFNEPRIHFAIVCAAVSCPPLRAGAFTPDRLDAQLDDQARRFLHDRTKNRIPDGEETIRLSKIFDWFAEDFGGEDRLQAYLAPYFEGEVRARLEAGAYAIAYLPYDWSLNDWKRAAAEPKAASDAR